MKALGKGSIASIVQLGLQIAWVVLWVLAFCLVIAAIGYGAILFLISQGMIDPALLEGGAGNAQVAGGAGNFHLTYDQPGGGTGVGVARRAAVNSAVCPTGLSLGGDR